MRCAGSSVFLAEKAGRDKLRQKLTAGLVNRAPAEEIQDGEYRFAMSGWRCCASIRPTV